MRSTSWRGGRWFRLLVAGFAFSVTAAVFGQPPPDGSTASTSVPDAWKGDLGVVVVATDETGAPVPGVAVTLRLGDAAFGIRGVLTDDQGRAEWLGLAAGEWQIELQREGFMLVTAYVKLQPGREPVVAFASRQRTGSYWAALEAVYLQPGTDVSAAVAAGRATPKEARRAAEREQKQGSAEEKRLERLSRRGRIARVVPTESTEPESASTESTESTGSTGSTGPTESPKQAEPAPVVAKTAKPAPAEPTLTKTEPSTAEPAKTDVAPRPVPAAPASATPLPRPQRAPDSDPPKVATTPVEPPASPKATASQPAPEPKRELRLLPNLNLLPAGACPECRPGEWSVAASTDATAGSSASCDPNAKGVIEGAARQISAGLDVSTTGFAGALQAADGNDVLRLLAPERRAEIAAALESAVSAAGACPVVGVVLPAGARYIGFRYQAGEARSLSECPPDADCQVGRARFTGPPWIVKTDRLTVVAGQFENGSAERARSGRITVYFVPPRGWLPPR